MSDATLRGIHPLFIVEDVAATADFYRSKLGFEYLFPEQAAEHLNGDFAILKRDQAVVLFKAVPNGKPRPNHTVHEYALHDAFIPVLELEPLCEELRSKGVRIVREITDTEWGTREFHFQDNSGYIFCCGHSKPPT
jgi:catechol 2,3-dioxygenase-like lactoylglutathione lyase family enzyme